MNDVLKEVLAAAAIAFITPVAERLGERVAEMIRERPKAERDDDET